MLCCWTQLFLFLVIDLCYLFFLMEPYAVPADWCTLTHRAHFNYAAAVWRLVEGFSSAIFVALAKSERSPSQIFIFVPCQWRIPKVSKLKGATVNVFSRESSESEEQCCSNAADHNVCDYTLIRRTYHTNGPLKCNGKLLGKNFFQLEPSVGDAE